MKKPTEKQKKILDFAYKNENKITKKQAVELIGYTYFLNENKHVGDVLTRMVKSKFLIRIKNGLYQINDKRTETVKNIVNPNQLELL